MGASSHGRYALVTNFREPGLNRDAPSRGALIGCLRGDEPPAEYMARVHDEGQAYNGFNLIVGDMEQAWYVSNRDGAADDELPATGLPPDREKLLSSPFIVSPTYGTPARPCWPCGSMAPGCCSGATRLTAR